MPNISYFNVPPALLCVRECSYNLQWRTNQTLLVLSVKSRWWSSSRGE